ncbi:N-acetylmuramoyl-L-alanine amidase [Kordiimonas marina]|uniref:N-acetylmuramoyl-L-alanine amidase n=1 Tax=Kordiimonas marina TaxID=2872312 RepID=UPI001FF387E6|nr:N-acetylmuramoyl-L-alanine amidase [Kordiimonas marina]MCJ9429492.1 N-acetylmuramoyl-L-alanine amidase [Kordiimonas marina]
MKIHRQPSPNFNVRPADAAVDTVILHYTGMETAEAALARLTDPKAEVSAHYLIDEDGRIVQMVEEEHRAWHAGVSIWQGRENLNHTSVGIELVNPGHEFGYRAFPDAQIEALLALLAGIRERHKIPVSRYLGHSDIAPHRKADPGELFPWGRLAREGFGLWSDVEGSDTRPLPDEAVTGEALVKLNKQLGIVGYHMEDKDSFGAAAQSIVRAFQAHWRPETVSGLYDYGTAAILRDIACQSEQTGESL